MNTASQPYILNPAGSCGRSFTFRLVPEADLPAALRRLQRGFRLQWGVLGIGDAIPLALGCRVRGLRPFPSISGPAVSIPSTQQALWAMLCGPDRGVVFDAAESLRALAAPDFVQSDAMDTFVYRGGRDLTGYEDGTENPRGDAAESAAIVAGESDLAGSSFVAVQRWVHDLDLFRKHTPEQRDNIIGRFLETNDEVGDAPASAHVKRSAQESYDPAAFMLRRSMPWAGATERGLEFVAYGESLDRFERVLRRMAGLDDGILDALFNFSRPITGGYYWCPPASGDRLDFSALGL